jgi:hypothetical protein
MFHQKSKHYTRILLFSALFLLAALPAYAGWMLCRSDPLIILSNGATFDISAGMSVPAPNVTEVHYTLHGPVGTSLVVSIGTPTWFTTLETFQYIADQPPGKYSATVLVHTTEGNAQVVANAVVLLPFGLHLRLHSVEGVEGVPIDIVMR